jgi:2-polyprenyl-6-methoxyphenol hydroxylase-like FAD-dependent oxidoreductase
MEENKRILIAGAGIAGLVCAYWLYRFGFEVTVIEKRDGIPAGGQNIDVKGPARDIAKLMGLEKSIRQHNTREKGIRFENWDRDIIAEFPKGDALSMTQELEILRGDLVKILYDSVKDTVNIHFGTEIKSVKDNGGNVSVSFSKGEKRQYRMVIGAEGIGSPTRTHFFEGKAKLKFLGLYTAYFTIPKQGGDTDWARWCNVPGGIVYLLRPDNYGSTRACVNFRSPEKDYQDYPLEEKKKLIAGLIKGTRWESERIIKALDAVDEIYLERLSQVKMDSWSNGNVVLTGDAAYCVTPIGGGGTDLAVTGGYVLAWAIAKFGDSAAAFGEYERLMRPYVDSIQQTPPGVPGLVYPTTRIGVGILNVLFRVASSGFFRSIAKQFGKRKKKYPIKLPSADALLKRDLKVDHV